MYIVWTFHKLAHCGFNCQFLFLLIYFIPNKFYQQLNVLFELQVQMLNLICPNFRWTHQTFWESPWITGLNWQQYPFHWTQAAVSVLLKISGLKPTMMKSTGAVLIRRKKCHNEHHFSDLHLYPQWSTQSLISMLPGYTEWRTNTYCFVWPVDYHTRSFWSDLPICPITMILIVTKFLAKVLGVWFWSINL